jgi:hypothetical protein
MFAFAAMDVRGDRCRRRHGCGDQCVREWDERQGGEAEPDSAVAGEEVR